jgi:Fe-S-cluster-containing dehydrogenase component
MKKNKLILRFPKDLVDKPIVYKLVKDYNLLFNILKAQVNPKEEGILILELEGKDADYKAGIEYLKKEGVKVEPLSKDISMNRERCVDCGVCIPLCPTKALIKNKDTDIVEFIKENCIACEICIKICPYKAMEIKL